jgi:ribosomal protein S5
MVQQLGYRESTQLDFGGEFCIMVMETKMVTNVVSLGRVSNFTSLVYCGNFNGVISYGRGRGRDAETSLVKAIENSKQNLIGINLDLYNSWPTHTKSYFNGISIEMWPRKEMNSWGSLILGSMIQVAGVNNCMFHLIQDKPKPLNLIYCFFKLMIRAQTPKTMAENYGFKSYEKIFGPSEKMKRYPSLMGLH